MDVSQTDDKVSVVTILCETKTDVMPKHFLKGPGGSLASYQGVGAPVPPAPLLCKVQKINCVIFFQDEPLEHQTRILLVRSRSSLCPPNRAEEFQTDRQTQGERKCLLTDLCGKLLRQLLNDQDFAFSFKDLWTIRTLATTRFNVTGKIPIFC